jgi:hypothetical protein
MAHELLSERQHHYVQVRLGPWLIKPLKRGAIGFERPFGRGAVAK